MCTVQSVTLIFQQKEMYPIKVTKSISEAAELLFLLFYFFNWNEFGGETDTGHNFVLVKTNWGKVFALKRKFGSDRVESHIHEGKGLLF